MITEVRNIDMCIWNSVSLHAFPFKLQAVYFISLGKKILLWNGSLPENQGWTKWIGRGMVSLIL